jgi:hypothetical protein
MDSGLALRAPRNDGEYQIRLSNSEVTNSQAASPVLFEAPGAPFVPFPSKHNEGSGAPSGAAYFVVRALLVEERGADRRATRNAFGVPGYLRRSPSGGGPRFLTEVFGLGVSQLLAGDHLVSPGGAPTPPGAQGRRSLKTQAPHLAPSTDVTG